MKKKPKITLYQRKLIKVLTELLADVPGNDNCVDIGVCIGARPGLQVQLYVTSELDYSKLPERRKYRCVRIPKGMGKALC